MGKKCTGSNPQVATFCIASIMYCQVYSLSFDYFVVIVDLFDMFFICLFSYFMWFMFEISGMPHLHVLFFIKASQIRRLKTVLTHKPVACVATLTRLCCAQQGQEVVAVKWPLFL